MRLLVVEDNASLVANLFEYFEQRGHQLDAAPDGVTGLHLATTQPYDAIILDWMLPRMDGRTMLEKMRRDGATATPVIMLTARDQLPDKITGFRTGADDYLTKPFALPELEVRLDAIVARAQGLGRRRVLSVGDLSLDLSTLDVTRAGRVVHLYPACRKLLEVLLRAAPAVVPRQQLEFALWGDDPPDGDLLRSHMYELRRAVDGGHDTRLVRTVPRVGYRIAPASDAEVEHA